MPRAPFPPVSECDTFSPAPTAAVKVTENTIIKQTSAEGIDLFILEVGSGDCLSGLPRKTLTPGLRKSSCLSLPSS